MKDLSIVIPLGISTPETPVLKYLKSCVESLKKQKTSFSYEIIFSCDNNVRDEIKNYLQETSCIIKWYEPYHYMRRGGIWKKIYNEWKTCNSKYIAFCHYDDIWSENKIHNQLSFMNDNKLELSWSRVQVIDADGNTISGDVSRFDELNKDSINVGSYAFCHSSILNKDSWFNCGILDKVDKAAAIYEHLQFVYSHKLKGKKDHNSTFYHRSHSDSVSNQFNVEKQFMKEQRELVNYSLEQVLKDAEELDIKQITQEIINSLP